MGRFFALCELEGKRGVGTHLGNCMKVGFNQERVVRGHVHRHIIAEWGLLFAPGSGAPNGSQKQTVVWHQSGSSDWFVTDSAV